MNKKTVFSSRWQSARSSSQTDCQKHQDGPKEIFIQPRRSLLMEFIAPMAMSLDRFLKRLNKFMVERSIEGYSPWQLNKTSMFGGSIPLIWAALSIRWNRLKPMGPAETRDLSVYSPWCWDTRTEPGLIACGKQSWAVHQNIHKGSSPSIGDNWSVGGQAWEACSVISLVDQVVVPARSAARAAQDSPSFFAIQASLQCQPGGLKASGHGHGLIWPFPDYQMLRASVCSLLHPAYQFPAAST